MEDVETKKAILQTLLEDLKQLEDKQKGKQKAGRCTDLELAIDFMRKDILSTQVSINDEILAHSTSAAISTDQSLLASIQRQDRVADQDHRLALALNNGQPVSAQDPNTPIRYESASENGDDAVSTAMGDLMERMSVNDESFNGEASTTHVPSHRAMTRLRECVSCLEQCASILFIGRCGHEFCLDCTRQMFLGAIQDEELYPPRCCGNVVPPSVAMRVLNYQELRDFSVRALEWAAKDRVYCADPTCSKFIPPFSIKGEHGTCPGCKQQTHLPCRSLAHTEVDCPKDETLPVVLEIGEAEGWKRCPHCRTMVELQQGCNHITCRCGREFCYVCAAAWRTCKCDLWFEDRLIDRANQVLDEEVPRHVDQAARQQMFERVVDDLLRHEDVGCEHHRSRQWAWRDTGSLQCEVCGHYLPLYIFMCKNCRMRACWRCRRHRLR